MKTTRSLSTLNLFASTALFGAFLLCPRVLAQQAAAVISNSSASPQAILARAHAATVVVLAGEGAGRLRSVSTGVVVSPDGVILTALHGIKGALEVQVRTPGGDVFDQVQLLGTDERRDVAALRIASRQLPALQVGNSDTLQQGDAVYAVTNAGGLAGSATSGIVAATRPADEIPGAGTGYRLIQFTASVAPGSSGGALLGADGTLIGIITSGRAPGTAFAVPVSSVFGLADTGHSTPLGSGAALQMPAEEHSAAGSLSSAAVSKADPATILKQARTIYLHSKTSFLTVDTLQRALLRRKDWPKLGLTIVVDERVADLVIEVDRPLFTYVHTFVLSDKRTSIVLDSGRQTAFDGTIASDGLAKDIDTFLAKGRLVNASPTTKN